MKMKLIQWRSPEEDHLIEVHDWIIVQPIEDQYIEYQRSFWILWNYFRKVGLKYLIQKVHSRFTESARNKKVAGIGLGRVIKGAGTSDIEMGESVIFFAPNHNDSRKVIPLNKHLVATWGSAGPEESLTVKKPVNRELPSALVNYIGWSPLSGNPLNPDEVLQALNRFANEIKDEMAVKKGQQPIDSDRYSDHYEIDQNSHKKPSAVLFGLGNYAKTIIIPNIKKTVSLQRVHELDPDQFTYFGEHPKVSLDTSPVPREGHQFDAWFIAGYHHTHTDLAISALSQQAYAVIEKPLSTTNEQFDAFNSALKEHPEGNFFLCFHKRYSKLNDYLFQDLNLTMGEPVDMHSIVYEIPLPDLHWYNWPNSGSRLISNGCHWLDFFMYVNDYSKAVEFDIWQPKGSDILIRVKLENRAYLNLSLTDTGSRRLGVRDYIELRKEGLTAKIVDAARYVSESEKRVLRDIKMNPLDSYKQMYKEITGKINEGSEGDSIKSLRSSELTLLLENELK